MINNKYAQVPPRIVIEVDTEIDFDTISENEYIQLKTKKILDFGAEKVLWVFTEGRKVTIATPNTPWITTAWIEDIEVLDGVRFNIAGYLKGKGINW